MGAWVLRESRIRMAGSSKATAQSSCVESSMRELIREHTGPPSPQWESLEWLVTNGLGGYAFGTASGLITRGYHGYLISSLPAPLGRMMMLNDVIEQVRLPDGTILQLGGEERTGL